MVRETDAFYLNHEEPNKSCLLALRKIILDQDETVNETRKWGMPCFCLRKRMFCYLWTDKKTKEPYLLFVDGKNLHHAELEQGNRSRMKIFRVSPDKDLPLGTIEYLLKEALELCRKKSK